MRVVVAPDSFKGNLTAAQAAHAIAHGITTALPGADVIARPMADGGDGTLDVLTEAWDVRPRTLGTIDALGRPRVAAYAISGDGHSAVVELAAASGLAHVTDAVPQPLHTHTVGTGQLIADALDAGVSQIMVCLGGSASTDGGAGILTALGARLLDIHGQDVPGGGEGLAHVARLDLTGLHPRACRVRWRVAVDVTNPLLGEQGTACVFGPQKGAGPADVRYLEHGLARWASVLAGATGVDVRSIPGGGAAGGVPATLTAVFGAQLLPGAALVAEAIGLPAAITGADLVITGEGTFDSQSLRGKVPHTVALLAAHKRPVPPPVVVLAGQVLVPAAIARADGIVAALSIAAGPVTLDDLLDHTATRLADLAAMIGAFFAAAAAR